MKVLCFYDRGLIYIGSCSFDINVIYTIPNTTYSQVERKIILYWRVIIVSIWAVGNRRLTQLYLNSSLRFAFHEQST